MIHKQYSNFIRDPFCIKQYAQFIDILLHHEEGAVLWHCSAGKDRVGIGTALLLSALDIPGDLIIEDYMMTNTFTNDEYESTVKALKAGNAPEAVLTGIEAVFRVSEDYMYASLKYITDNYGSAVNYIKDALGITEDEIKKLKNMYLES